MDVEQIRENPNIYAIVVLCNIISVLSTYHPGSLNLAELRTIYHMRELSIHTIQTTIGFWYKEILWNREELHFNFYFVVGFGDYLGKSLVQFSHNKTIVIDQQGEVFLWYNRISRGWF